MGCDTFRRMFLSFLGEGNVKIYKYEPGYCAFDIRKPKVHERVTSGGGHPVYSLQGVVQEGEVVVGDVVTLEENADRTCEDIWNTKGCRCLTVHKYPEYGIAHIHFDCRNPDQMALARLLLRE